MLFNSSRVINLELTVDYGPRIIVFSLPFTAIRQIRGMFPRFPPALTITVVYRGPGHPRGTFRSPKSDCMALEPPESL